jgi:hypothetical protein
MELPFIACLLFLSGGVAAEDWSASKQSAWWRVLLQLKFLWRLTWVKLLQIAVSVSGGQAGS